MISCFVLCQLPLSWLLYSLAFAATPKDILDKANISRTQIVFAGFKILLIYGLVSIFCLYAITRAYNDIYNDQTAAEYPIWNIWKFFQYTQCVFAGWAILIIPCLCFSCGLIPLGELLKNYNRVIAETLVEQLMQAENEV